MPDKLKNVIEDIARDFLNSALTLRYDICTCAVCKNDMLAYILSHVPAKYVTTDQGALHTIMQQTRAEHQATIARAIIQAIDIVSKSPRHQVKEDKNETFQLLLSKIKEDRNLDFRHYHQDLLRRRVAVRIRTLGLPNYSEYLRLLINNPEEYDRLFEVLCINVSEFLRDPEAWAQVRKHFESCIRNKKADHEKSVRIWSAGCANGEEPYTIAILLREVLGAELSGFTVEVIATDVDKLAMDTAKAGIYEKHSVKNLDKKIVDKYFTAAKGSYEISGDIKAMVSIRYLDLTTTDLIKDNDFVFCRNVFIYFDRSLQEQLLMKFYNGLKPDGHLVMGKSETLIREATQIFEPIDVENRIYRKKAV
ncbi:MAG: late competence development ComFB family protein [Candidatus Omnitrophica bacterium]|jgi:chemotaxis protein methyltransferase CheR|nr:late competence development ComFB family protein [Candidatus Omnitrophota bacterium]